MRRFIIALAFIAGLLAPSVAEAQQLGCDQKPFVYDASTNGITKLNSSAQQPQAGAAIFICGYVIFAAGTVNVDLRFGTQTTNPCDTGATKLTPAYEMTTQNQVNDVSPFWRGMLVPSLNDLCINTSAGVPVQAIVYWALKSK